MRLFDPRPTRYFDVTLTLLRIIAGLMMIQHGAQKLFGVLGGAGGAGQSVPLFSLMGLAGVIELFLALLVAIGLLTRVAALILSGEMAAAYFMAHASKGFWPLLNQGELAVLYFFVFLFLAAAGAGPFSVDALISKSRVAPEPIRR